MAYLLDPRFQEIAQWVTAAGGDQFAEIQQSPWSDGGTVTPWIGDYRRITDRYTSWSSGAFDEQRYGATLYTLRALDDLVARGEIKEAEADAFVRQQFPDWEWLGGNWSDQRPSQAAETIIDQSAAPSTDPDKIDADEAAETINEASPQTISAAGAPGSTFIPTVEALPVDYDQSKIQEVIEDLASQVALNDLALGAGNINFPAGRIPGGAIAPGTLPATAMEPLAWSKLLNQMPGPEAAVGLTTKRSSTVDRWVQGGTNRGPGRAQGVTSVQFPAGWQPYRGVHRYRIVDKRSRFGVMSMIASVGGTAPSWIFYANLYYGYVLHRIPHYLGRPPVGIQALQYVGEAPVPFGYENTTTLVTGTPTLFHTRAQDEYQTTAKSYGAPLDTDPILDPTTAEIEAAQGISVSLITGRTAQEVYQQINTRRSGAGPGITSSGHGPSLTLPEGLQVSAPAPAGVLDWEGSIAFRWDPHAEATDLSTLNHLSQGVPFSYEDCAKMVPNDTHFSLVVQMDMEVERILASGMAAWPSPEEWHAHGLRLDIADDRVLELDALIY